MDATPVVRLRVLNTLLELVYPPREDVLGVLDTGYAGFLLLPEAIFDELRFSELKPTRTMAVSADGRSVELVGCYGTIEFPEAAVSVDGLVQTCKGASEILVGTDAIRGLEITLNYCDLDVHLRQSA